MNEIEVLSERLNNSIETTLAERQRRREWENTLLEKVDQMNNRSIRREGEGCTLLKQHIAANGKEKEYKRKLWDTRIFQLGIIIFSVIVTQVCGIVFSEKSRNKMLNKVVREEMAAINNDNRKTQ